MRNAGSARRASKILKEFGGAYEDPNRLDILLQLEGVHGRVGIAGYAVHNYGPQQPDRQRDGAARRICICDARSPGARPK